MVAVGDVALVGDARDDAKAALQALGELVGGGLERRAVERVVDVLGGLPLGALVVHALHDGERERRGLLVGVAVAGHGLDALVEAGVAQGDRGVAAVEQLVDLLALLEAGEGAVLPEDRRGVRGGAEQALVAAAQGAVAQLQALVEDLPELVHVAVGGERHVDEVDGHDALVEAAVVLGLARLVVAGVGHVVKAVARAVRREEGAAAHAGVAVAVALGLALGELVLPHLLLGDVVRHHALGRALGGELGEVEVRGALADVVLLEHVDQLRERRRDPDALLVLDALVALLEHLFDAHGQVGLLALVLGLVEVHEDRDERRLAVGGHEGDDLVLDGLDAAGDLLAHAPLHDLGDLLLAGVGVDGLHLGLHLAADLLARDVHERGEVRERDGLAAVLAGGHLGDDLRGDVAGGGEAVRALDQRAGDHGAVLQHVLEVHEVAVVHVLGEVVRVVEVDDALVVGFHDLGREQLAHREVLGDLAGHVVALDGDDRGVLVGVLLLDLLVVALDQREDLVVGRVLVALLVLNVAVDDVLAGHLEVVQTHELVLDEVLDLLDRDGVAGLHALVGDVQGGELDLALGEALLGGNLGVGGADGVLDLGDVEGDLRAVSLDDLHVVPTFRLRGAPRGARCSVVCAHQLCHNE